MVVCKFFQEGSCRFGENCKFEHVCGSKCNYNANNSNQPMVVNIPADELLTKQVRSDIEAALIGRQWILSNYSPFKEKPVFPGIIDMSPEEARLIIYEAKANNSLKPAMEYVTNLMKENKTKFDQLLEPTPAIKKVLRRLYRGEINIPSPFMNTPQSGFRTSTSSTNASSVFRSAAQSNSVFVQSQPNPGGFGASNVFAQSPGNSAAKSIFAQASQTAFNQNPAPNNVFGAPAENAVAKSIFSQANQSIFSGNQSAPTQNVFGSQSVFSTQPSQFPTAANTDPFNQTSNASPIANATNIDPFNQASNASPFAQNVFQQEYRPFGNVFQQQAPEEPGVYSRMEVVSKEDLEAFSSQDFRLGFIPEVPPPRELCF